MLSIIIIARNEEKYLPRLLDSIKNQSYKDYEIILSDANSTDRTREIAKKYGCRIIKGGLPSIGRNNGANASKGDILLFLDSDVVLPENFLKSNISEFKKRELVTANPKVIPISDNIIDKAIFFLFNLWSKIMQFSTPCVAGFCIFCKKNIFIKTGGFNERLLILEDLDFVKSTTEYGRFRILSSSPVFVSVRKFEKEGRFNLSMKYTYMGLYYIIFGKNEKPIVNYELNGVNVNKGKIIDR